ncbi:hypothetical protein AB4254_09075 [Vibrio breoganii]
MRSDWHINVRGASKSVSVENILSFCRENNHTSTYSLRRSIAESKASIAPLLTCACCGNNVILSRNKGTLFLKHQNSSSETDTEALIACPFYSLKNNDIFEQKSKKESKTTRVIKAALEHALKSDKLTKTKSIARDRVIHHKNQSTEWRSPDIYFELKNSEAYALELINFWINPELIKSREEFYRENNINVIWLTLEEKIHRSTFTFGDLMFGSNQQRNVFSISVPLVKQSLKDKKLLMHVHFPEMDKQPLTINQQTIGLELLNTNKETRIPYYKDCSGFAYSTLQDYLMRTLNLEFCNSDDDVLLEYHQLCKKEITNIIGAANTFEFSKARVLKNINSINKFTRAFTDLKTTRTERTLDILKLNIEVLDTLESLTSSSKHVHSKLINKSLSKLKAFKNRHVLLDILIENKLVTIKCPTEQFDHNLKQLNELIERLLHKKHLSIDEYIKLSLSISKATRSEFFVSSNDYRAFIKRAGLYTFMKTEHHFEDARQLIREMKIPKSTEPLTNDIQTLILLENEIEDVSLFSTNNLLLLDRYKLELIITRLQKMTTPHWFDAQRATRPLMSLQQLSR